VEDQYGVSEEGVSLKFPKSLLERIFFILFYPVFVILYFLPNYLDNPIPKKLVLCLVMNIVLLGCCVFLLDWWLYEISMGTGIPMAILGLLIGGPLLNLNFFYYNLRVLYIYLI
jgi:hypothetical protein